MISWHSECRKYQQIKTCKEKINNKGTEKLVNM